MLRELTGGPPGTGAYAGGGVSGVNGGRGAGIGGFGHQRRRQHWQGRHLHI